MPRRARNGHTHSRIVQPTQRETNYDAKQHAKAIVLIAGIVSYDRPESLERLLRTVQVVGVFGAVVVVCDASSKNLYDRYMNLAIRYGRLGDFVVKLGKRGSAAARNVLFDYVSRNYLDNDVLVMLDDDYELDSKESLFVVKEHLSNMNIGIVGGKLIPRRYHRIDPDFRLELLPAAADVLSQLTGFVFLDCRHGPRFVRYTTPLMAIKVRLLRNGIRYDGFYVGSAYREESDLQAQTVAAGWTIVFDPRFRAYDYAEAKGGNRSFSLVQRFYYKARNNARFQMKFHPLLSLLLSQLIIQLYALRYGIWTFISAARGFREGLLSRR